MPVKDWKPVHVQNNDVDVNHPFGITVLIEGHTCSLALACTLDLAHAQKCYLGGNKRLGVSVDANIEMHGWLGREDQRFRF